MARLNARLVIAIAAALATDGRATADEPEFTGLHFSGDGSDPSFLDVINQNVPHTQDTKSASSVGAQGDAIQSYPIELPRTLYGPSLAFSYGASTPGSTILGRGWDLSGIPSIVRAPARQEATVYAHRANTFILSGASSGALMWQADDTWRLASATASHVRAWHPDDDHWVVRGDGITTCFATPDLPERNGDPASWVPIASWDPSGNAVRYAWNGQFLVAIDAGGQLDVADLDADGGNCADVAAGEPIAPFNVHVEMLYDTSASLGDFSGVFDSVSRLAWPSAFAFGERRIFDRLLVGVAVSVVPEGEGLAETWRVYRCHYGIEAGEQRLISIDALRDPEGPSWPIGDFFYAGLDIQGAFTSDDLDDMLGTGLDSDLYTTPEWLSFGAAVTGTTLNTPEPNMAFTGVPPSEHAGWFDAYVGVNNADRRVQISDQWISSLDMTGDGLPDELAARPPDGYTLPFTVDAGYGAAHAHRYVVNPRIVAPGSYDETSPVLAQVWAETGWTLPDVTPSMRAFVSVDDGADSDRDRPSCDQLPSETVSRTVTVPFAVRSEPQIASAHAFQTVVTTDVDGDGWVDIVWTPDDVVQAVLAEEVLSGALNPGSGDPTGDEPTAYNVMVPTLFNLDNPAPLTEHTGDPVQRGWCVAYGGPHSTGAGLDRFFERAPTLAPGYSQPTDSTLAAVHADSPFSDPTVFSDAVDGRGVPAFGSLFSLVDTNGDGMQDIVAFAGVTPDHTVRTWRKKPGRGTGWELEPDSQVGGEDAITPYFLGNAGTQPIGSAAFWGDTYSSDFVAAGVSIGSSTVDPSKVSVHMQVQRAGMYDMNGDGLVDYVVAVTSDVVHPTDWDVYYGTGMGFEAVPEPWLNPSGFPFVAVSSEGQAGTLTCHPQVGLSLAPPKGIDVHHPGHVETTTEVAGMAHDSADEGCDVGLSIPSVELAGLLDVDGDGLVDLVNMGLDDGDFRVDAPASMADYMGGSADAGWWKNLGDGFSDKQLPLPDFWPHAISTQESSQAVWNGHVTDFRNFATQRLMDVNHDGLLDNVVPSTFRRGRSDDPGFIEFGWNSSSSTDPQDWALPGALVAVVDGAGLDSSGGYFGARATSITSYHWKPESTVWPAGTDGILAEWHGAYEPRVMAEPIDLGAPEAYPATSSYSGERTVVRAVEFEDWVSGVADYTEFIWRYPTASGAGLLGYGERQVATEDQGRRLAVTTTSSMFTATEALPTLVEVHTDPRLHTIPDWHGSSLMNSMTAGEGLTLRSEVWTDYSAFRLGDEHGGSDNSTYVSRVDKLCATEWGEAAVAPSSRAARGCADMVASNATLTRSWSRAISYDGDSGKPSVITHLDPQTPDAGWRVDLDWLGSADGTMWKPRERVMRNASTDKVEELHLGYDGSAAGEDSVALSGGRLTAQAACADGVDGEDVCSTTAFLDWSFDRNARGQVNSTTGPRYEVTVAADFAFGGTTPQSVTKWAGSDGTGVEFTDVVTLDAFGRTLTKTDASGIVHRYAYDDRDRPTGEWVTGVGGTEHAVTTTSYSDDTVPRYTAVTTFKADGDPDAASYSLFDGSGHVLQTWTQHPDGWLVNSSLYDARGNTVGTSIPTVVPVGSLDLTYSATTYPTQQQSAYDAFGRARYSFRDQAWAASMPGPTRRYADLVLYDDAAEQRTIDAAGYVKCVRTDSNGKVSDVRQARGAQGASRWENACDAEHGGVQTASYEWDPDGRMLSFTDANGNSYWYDWDGVGRLRQVSRASPTATSPQPYFAYDYDGQYPTATYEGTTADRKVVEWTHDMLGRPVQKRMVKPNDGTSADTWGTVDWRWDTDWVGGLSAVDGPWGTDVIEYGDNNGMGALGWPTVKDRSFSAFSVTVEKHFEYDLAGRVTHAETVPLATGVPNLDVETVYDHGVPVEDLVRDGTSVLADVSLGYDEAGRPAGWASDDGFSMDLHWERASRPQSLHGYVPGHIGGEAVQQFEDPGRNQWITSKQVHVWDPDSALPDFDDAGLSPYADIDLEYTYDALGRVDGVLGPTQSYEAYTYDRLGNLTFMSRDTPQFGTASWSYSWTDIGTDVPAFQELTGRSTGSSTPSYETYDYDSVTGRMTSWSSQGPPLGLVSGSLEHDPGATREMFYDGAGRLGEMKRGSATTGYVYGPDDALILKTSGGDPAKAYFEDMSFSFADETMIIDLLPMLRWRDGDLLWLFAEPDGHPLAIAKDSDSSWESVDVSGAYGRPIASIGAWDEERLHGQELDRDNAVTQMGVRSVMATDGRWLQPEPLLGLGLGQSNTAPTTFSGPYAGGNPIAGSDRSGYCAEDGCIGEGIFAWEVGGELLELATPTIQRGLAWLADRVGTSAVATQTVTAAAYLSQADDSPDDGAEADDNAENSTDGARGPSAHQRGPSASPHFDDPARPPGDGWEWRGNGEPGSGKGSWYNPETGESLHPDLDHPDPIGPHFDWQGPDTAPARVYPDGRVVPK